MTMRLFEREFPTDRLPLLRWLMFTGVTAFGFVLAWHYGLFHLMLASDKTYISATITVLYVAISLHCLARTATISRELDSAQRVFALVSRGTPGFRLVGPDVVTADGTKLPPGQVTGHIRNLILKARLQGHQRLDQTLLLRGLADALRGPNQLGPFASDALMKLGLLGTIIGFILMLAPIAGLDAADRASVKSSMGLMSDGMAVAMYTTLTGLIGSVLVQTQYYMLDEATAKVFGLATDLTEVFVVSVLEQEPPASLQSSYALRASEDQSALRSPVEGEGAPGLRRASPP
jgi:MotA/TolQ/ExbB proton channel family